MNAFNRVMTILLFVTLMIIIPMVAIFTDGTLGVLQGFINAASAGMSIFYRVILILVGVISFLICGLVLYLEVRRPPRRRVRVRKVSGGEVELAVESIEQRLEYRVDQLPDVVKVIPKVRARRSSVDVELNVETSPDIDVPMKTDEVCQVARDVVEDRMGLKLRKIKVNLRHAPYHEIPQEVLGQ